MNISQVKNCADCGMCVTLCPNQAITVKTDGLFYQPEIDFSKCTDCGLCLNRCPVNNTVTDHKSKSAFYAVNRDDDIVKKSSSGGVFSALADVVLKQGGVVFGAAFSGYCKEIVIKSTDEVDLDELRRSKYAESLTGDSFVQVKEQLRLGKKVFYCATPCQIAGLKAYLNKDYKDLITCDFVCGGLPSHKIYREYIEYLEEKFDSRVTSVNFRPKTYGWREYTIKVNFENGREYLKQACLDPYFSAFLHHRYTIRELCVDCPFPSARCSDITLADFWGYRSIIGKTDSNKGISLVFANTDRGAEALELIGEKTELNSIPLEKVSSSFERHGVPENYREKREAFMKDYKLSGIVSAGKKHCVYKGKKAFKARLRVIKNNLKG